MAKPLSPPRGVKPTRDTRQLNWFLAWAVVFCDIGTSVYYVPGILYGHVKDATPFFVLVDHGRLYPALAKIHRNFLAQSRGWRRSDDHDQGLRPDLGLSGRHANHGRLFSDHRDLGGCGLSICRQRLPGVGRSHCFAGLHGVGVLAALNIVGIRESATVSLVMACASFLVNMVVIAMAFITMDGAQLSTVLSRLGIGKGMSRYEMLVGFSSAWLAFSGLESISQLSPTMNFPLRRTTRWAMTAVIVTMVITSPVLTALSIGLLPEHLKATESERFISELGLVVGGLGIKLAVVLTASSLLLFASNTAIIGAYHVFLAFVNGDFLPESSRFVTTFLIHRILPS